MSTQHIRYTMADLLSRFGLETDDAGFLVQCPWCKKKKKLHVDFEENEWNCVSCTDIGDGGGVFHFFALYVNGEVLSKPMSSYDKKRIRRQMIEYFGDDTPNAPARPVPKPQPSKPKICIASDAQLNMVYSAMLDIPALQLLPHHKENLMRRGLSEEAIIRNQYRSVPKQYRVPDCYADMYKEEGGNKLRTSHEKLRTMGAREVMLGLMVAHHVESKGISLQGVPGFFKFGNRWCCWLMPGMLIPTRNHKGEIILFQIRKDSGSSGAKYLTVSRSDFPGHVNSGNISRTHFPLANASIHPANPVLITEGPLKADIACHLHGSPAVFLAILGVKNTAELIAQYVPILKEAGIFTVYNAFDMDRLTNDGVRAGSLRLLRDLEEKNMKLEDVFWDYQYAAFKKASLLLLARTRNVPVTIPANLSVHAEVDIIAKALDDAKVNHSRFKDANGEEYKLYWNDETKGIDDYYLLRQKRRAHRQF